MKSTRSIERQTDGGSLFVIALCSAVIVVVIVALLGRSIQFDFINYDDPAYVYENEVVSQGLSTEGVKWAMTEVGETNLWHPLTWLSHMTDVQMFGIQSAGGHHAVNVFWHAIGALGLFFLLRRITGNTAIAFFLALLWAVHPQRVQSVVWISERKDVLSGAFFLWSWWSWEKWRDQGSNKGWYLLSIGLFFCAGLSKPSVVPLPLILWLREMLRERVFFTLKQSLHWGIRVAPFVIISAIVAGLTIYFQRTGGMADASEMMPLTNRIILMPMSLWWYIQHFVAPFPGKLWVYPPESGTANIVSLMIPVAALLMVILAVIFLGRRERIVWFGGGVFLLLWLPVSGIVPVSFYYVADRYSYLIHLGLLIVLGSVVSSLFKRVSSSRHRSIVLSGGAVVIIFALTISWFRVEHWKNSETLFSHEREINPRSLSAPIHLGSSMEKKGQYEEALALFYEALEKDKESGLAATNAGKMLVKLGRKQEAFKMYTAASVKKTLHDSEVFRLLALLYIEQNHIAQAVSTLERGLKRFPEEVKLMLDLGVIATKYQKEPKLALKWYERVLAINEFDADAMQGKAVALIEMGRVDEGIELLKKLLKHHPDRSAVRKYLQGLPAQ